jgi:hypothetical protein
MPIIGARVTAETKTKFEALARLRDVTSSRLAASLISDFMKQEAERDKCADSPPPQLTTGSGVSGQSEHKTEQVFVRLEPYYFAELGLLANERHWYRGTYLGNLFRAHLNRRPVLCDLEINAVRQVARQLADMGRNLNQISRKLNNLPENACLLTSIDFQLVRMLIDLEMTAIKDLIRANLRGWGISDVEA